MPTTNKTETTQTTTPTPNQIKKTISKTLVKADTYYQFGNLNQAFNLIKDDYVKYGTQDSNLHFYLDKKCDGFIMAYKTEYGFDWYCFHEFHYCSFNVSYLEAAPDMISLPKGHKKVNFSEINEKWQKRILHEIMVEMDPVYGAINYEYKS